MPVKEVLICLYQQVGVDLEIAEEIKGNVFFSATDKPFIYVIEKLVNMIKWRYHVNGTSLRLEPDSPYLKNYNIQFLSLKRESKDSISVATKLVNTGSNVSLNNGSETSIQSSMNVDFWEELANNLEIILLDETQQPGKKAFAIHKQSGILSIHATDKKHRLIEKYLERLKRISTSQVLIEAKVVEVALKDQYKSGIDWESIGSNLGISGLFGGAKYGTDKGFSAKIGPSKMNAIINLMNEFGTSRTLASPRLTVMNNQPAILKVVEHQVYFNMKYDQYYPNTTSSNPQPYTNVSSQIQTVPIGLILTVHPSIDIETGEIILALRPTISSTSRSVPDPAIVYQSQKNGTEVKSEIPVIKVEEINSVLKIGEEMVILGGMMKEVVENRDAGLPGMADTPFKGLFGNTENNRDVRELVIFLRAKIVGDYDISAADQRLLTKYTRDPRP